MLFLRCMSSRTTILTIVLLTVISACSLATAQVAAPRITGIRVSPTPNSVRVFVDLDKAVQFKYSEAGSPPVLTIEIPDAASSAPAGPIPISREPVRQVVVIPAEGGRPARVEISFSSPARWDIATGGGGRLITITVKTGDKNDVADTAPSNPAQTSAVVQPAPGTESATSRPLQMALDRNQPVPSGEGLECSFKDADLHDVIQVIAKLVGANIVADSSVQGKITLSLTNIGWEEGLGTALKSLGLSLVRDGSVYVVTKAAPEVLPTVSVQDGKLSVSATQVDIKRLLAAISEKSGLNIVASQTVDGKISVQLSGVPVEDGVYTFLSANGYSFRKLQDIYVVDKVEAGKSKPPMRPYKQVTAGKISIDYKDTELSEVLQDLSAQTGKNIVTYGQITEKVTMRLADVTLEEALKLLLAGTKYSWRKVDEVFVVGDASNLASPVAQMLTVTEIIPIKYIKAEECPKYLSAVVPAANIKPLKEQNALLVVGTEEMIARIKTEIALVDRVAPQVMIEAQIIEVLDTANKNLGLEFQGAEGMFNAKLPGTGQMVYTSTGTLSKSLVATLQALLSEGKAKVLANPKVTTINGQEANINISQQRYFRTNVVPDYNSGNGNNSNNNNNVPYYYPYSYGQVQSVEAGIILKILPFVGGTDQITVDIEPEVSNVTGTGPDGLPEVSRRKAKTTVRVKNGETIVIGGLKQREESKSVTRTPILSDIPLIGQLFTSRTNNTREAELMIFITPTLLSTDGSNAVQPDGKEISTADKETAPSAPPAPAQPEKPARDQPQPDDKAVTNYAVP